MRSSRSDCLCNCSGILILMAMYYIPWFIGCIVGYCCLSCFCGLGVCLYYRSVVGKRKYLPLCGLMTIGLKILLMPFVFKGGSPA